MPLISVVMPVYNQEKYVSEAVKSILNQTFKDFEFIIVDDGSTDKTIEIIKSFDDQRIRLVQAEHKGFIEALKLATDKASGKWLARMDSDDICISDRLERQLNFLSAHPECVILTNPYGIITPNDKLLLPITSSKWRYFEAKDITLATSLFCDPSTIYDREIAIKAGYDEWEVEKPLWYKMLAYGKGVILDEPLYFIRWRIGSVSRGQIKYPTDINYQIRQKFDKANAVALEQKYKRNTLQLEWTSVVYYALAGDYRSAKEVAFKAFRNNQVSFRTIKMLLLSLGLKRYDSASGAGGATFVPINDTQAYITQSADDF